MPRLSGLSKCTIWYLRFFIEGCATKAFKTERFSISQRPITAGPSGVTSLPIFEITSDILVSFAWYFLLSQELFPAGVNSSSSTSGWLMVS